MISGVRNVSTLDRGRRQDPRPGTAAGSQVGSGWRCPEDLSLPPPTLRWAELAHRPYGLAAVGPGCDTTDLRDEDRGRSRCCARPWPDDAGCRDPAAVVAVGTCCGQVQLVRSSGCGTRISVLSGR